MAIAKNNNPFSKGTFAAPPAATAKTEPESKAVELDQPLPEFQMPGGDLVKIVSFVDQLLLMKPLETQQVMTKNGQAEATVTDLVAFGDDGTVEEHDNVMVFQQVLRRDLNTALRKGTMMVGILRKAPNPKRGEDKYVWVFEEPSDEQIKLCQQYVAANR